MNIFKRKKKSPYIPMAIYVGTGRTKVDVPVPPPGHEIGIMPVVDENKKLIQIEFHVVDLGVTSRAG